MTQYGEGPGGCNAEPFENADLGKDRRSHTKSQERVQSLIRPTLTEMAAAIKAEHLAARRAGETFIEHAVNVGKLLIEAKANVPHGDWLQWLDGNCEISERMSQHYMRLARNLPKLPPSKTKSISDLTLTRALEQLGRKSRPPMKVGPAIAASGPVVEPNEIAQDELREVVPVEAETKVSEVAELRPEPAISQETTGPGDPEPEMSFKEDDEKLRQRRNMWRIRYRTVLDDVLTLEDAQWALTLLQWRIRNRGRRND